VSERLVETNAQRDRDSKKHVSDSKQSNFMKNAQVSHFKFCYSNHRDKDSINRADFAQKDPRGLFLILIIFLQIRLSQQNSTHLTTLVAPIALIAVALHSSVLFCFVAPPLRKSLPESPAASLRLAARRQIRKGETHPTLTGFLVEWVARAMV